MSEKVSDASFFWSRSLQIISSRSSISATFCGFRCLNFFFFFWIRESAFALTVLSGFRCACLRRTFMFYGLTEAVFHRELFHPRFLLVHFSYCFSILCITKAGQLSYYSWFSFFPSPPSPSPSLFLSILVSVTPSNAS